MRYLGPLIVSCSLIVGLMACGNNPGPVETLPIETFVPTLASDPDPFPEETSAADEQVVVGDTSFAPRVVLGEATALAAADFDRDGNLDLVLAKEPDLNILLGDGEGGFTAVSRVVGGQQPDELEVADINQDGSLDIIVANHDTQYLTILLGDGKGLFQPAAYSPMQINVRPHPHTVRAVDLDGDNILDLIVDNREGHGLLVLKGLGEGRFETPGTLVDVGGDPYRGLGIGDINGDGKPDLVTPNPGDVGVLINHSGEQIAFQLMPAVDAEAPFGVAVGDFNGDGKLDIISAADEGSSLIEVFFGDGQGGFEKAVNAEFQLARGGKYIVVGDFNGDSLADAAIASYTHPDVLLLLGGANAFQSGFLSGGKNPWAMVAGDFNNDGRDDLVIVDDAVFRPQVFLSLPPE